MKNTKLLSEAIFSGSVGYIDPNGDFDFNVIIRSAILQSNLNYVCLPVGGAITIESNAEEEYEESIIKAKSLTEALNWKIQLN